MKDWEMVEELKYFNDEITQMKRKGYSDYSMLLAVFSQLTGRNKTYTSKQLRMILDLLV